MPLSYAERHAVHADFTAWHTCPVLKVSTTYLTLLLVELCRAFLSLPELRPGLNDAYLTSDLDYGK